MYNLGDNVSTRDAYGKILVELGAANERIMVFGSDVDDSNKIQEFEKRFPRRFFKSGISEAHMVSRALGWAYEGFIPVVNSFAAFGSHRGYDQIFQGLRRQAHALFVFSHAGLGVGQDGESAQAITDMTLMASIPGMAYVFDPIDAAETAQLMQWAVTENDKPVYIRTRRQETPVLVPSDHFVPGKARVLRDGSDAAIVACGPIVNHALEAAQLPDLSVRVIAQSTIKPIDVVSLAQAVKGCSTVCTLEDHGTKGGLGDAVSEALQMPVHRFGMERYGATGTPEELYKAFQLDGQGIAQRIRSIAKAQK